MLTEMRDTVGSVLLGEGIEPEKATKDQALPAIEKIEKASKRRPDPALHRQRVHQRPRARATPTRSSAGRATRVQLMADNENIALQPPRRGVHDLHRHHADPGRRAARVHGARSMMDFVYDPEIAGAAHGVHQLRAAGEGRQGEILAKTRPGARRERADLPRPREDAQLQDVLTRGRGGDRRRLPAGDRRVAENDPGGAAAVTCPAASGARSRTCCSRPGLLWLRALLRGPALLHGAHSRSRRGTIFTGFEFAWNFQTTRTRSRTTTSS